MIIETYIPGPPLDRFVEFMIFHESYNPGHNWERFLPDGNVELVIDLHDEPKFIFDNDLLIEIQACRKMWFSGLRTEPITIPTGGDASMMVVNFRRGMAYPFLPFPMTEIADRVVDVELVWGDAFDELREKVIEHRLSREKFLSAEAFLVRHLTSKIGLNPCVEFAVGTITDAPHRTSMRALSEKIGYSQKHFISMFKRHVGVTPKQYLKLMRFQRAVGLIESTEIRDWSDLSLKCGFFDQSHLINDFKTLSGFTPEDYARRRGNYLNYVPVRSVE